MRTSIDALKEKGRRLRIDSLKATTEAGSGHPTSCCSAADLMSVVFFNEMQFDPKDPHNPVNDRFVLSKGHAAPLLWSAYAECGIIDTKDLLKQTGAEDISSTGEKAVSSHGVGTDTASR